MILFESTLLRTLLFFVESSPKNHFCSFSPSQLIENLYLICDKISLSGVFADSSFHPFAFHISLQDDGGTDLIHQRLVLPLFLFQSAVDHCLQRHLR